MLTHPLAEHLRGLGMAAMADAFLEMQTTSAATDLTREDWLGLLLNREVTARDNKRLGRRLRQARLRQNAVVEDTDFRTPWARSPPPRRTTLACSCASLSAMRPPTPTFGATTSKISA